MTTTVDSELITDGAVTALKLATDAVTTAKILNANVTPAKLSQPLTQGTLITTTSGTAADFTGIPSWAKRITVALNGVSLSGTAGLLLQLGTSSGVESTGYASQINAFNNTPGGVAVTNGVQIAGLSAATYAWNGVVTIVNVAGNTWVAAGVAMTVSAAATAISAGAKTLAGVLDRIRITSTGADTFDAGSINILYE